MRERLDALISDLTLTSIALGIAIGYALFQVGRGLAATITTLLHHYPSADLRVIAHGDSLTWQVGSRVFTIGDLLGGLIELAVVVGVAMFVTARRRDAA